MEESEPPAMRINCSNSRGPSRMPIAAGRPHSPSPAHRDRKSTRLNSSHSQISYAVFCLKKTIETTTDKAGGELLGSQAEEVGLYAPQIITAGRVSGGHPHTACTSTIVFATFRAGAARVD